jgi:hypothetical protein
MDSEQLARFCQKHKMSVSERNIDNSNLNQRLEQTRTQFNGQTTTALKIAEEAAAARSVKMSAAEAEARMRKAQSQYALREFSRLIVAKELLAKKPEEWDKLPKRNMLDMDSGQGAGVILTR